MSILEKTPAGAEVLLNLPSTLSATVADTNWDNDEFVITGNDAELIDGNGDSHWLSDLVEKLAAPESAEPAKRKGV